MATNRQSSGAFEAAKLRALLDAAVDGVITIRHDGIIESANTAAAKLFGYPVEDFAGRNVKFLMPPPDADRHDGYLQRYHDTREPRIIGIGREVTGLRRDGTTFPMHLSVGEYQQEDTSYFIGIVHDLSKRKAAEEAFFQVQKMDSIGQLTGGIAHDFNNLLTVILGNLELLEMQLADALHRELIGEAKEAANLAAKLTTRLLAFARRSQLAPETVNLNTLVLGLTDLLQRTLGETVRLSSALSPGLWTARVDPAQMESAIVNLAINARDAIDRDGLMVLETRNVTFSDRDVVDQLTPVSGDFVQLSITDTGAGMSEDVRQKACEPFFTTKETGRGTGLGLSMVYGFAKQSGGHLMIYSELGRGTTINIYLPRHDGTESSSSRDRTETPAKAGRGETILVVEDDPKVRRLTVRRLTELDYRVMEASDAPEALSTMKAVDKIDLVFTDLVMPGGMSGLDLCGEIRKKYPNSQVVLTSGYAEDLIRGEQLTAKDIRILRKPYRMTELASIVREVLDSR